MRDGWLLDGKGNNICINVLTDRLKYPPPFSLD
jgi:hypothetical protein